MLDHLRILARETGERAPVLVLLHGRGSDMGDLQGLRSVLSERASLVTPQAPHSGQAWGYGPGWAWYRYLGEDRAEPAPMKESLGALEGFLHALPETLGFDPDPLVLGGFSQGGTMALAYALTHPGDLAGVVNLSGFLVSAESLHLELGKLANTPTFWAHGTQDPAVPFSLALRGRERLRNANLNPEERDYPIGHWVSPEEMKDLQDWLGREIPGWEG